MLGISANNIFPPLGSFYPFSILAKIQTLSEFETNINRQLKFKCRTDQIQKKNSHFAVRNSQPARLSPSRIARA